MGKVSPKSSYKNIRAAAKSERFFAAKQADKKAKQRQQPSFTDQGKEAFDSK